MPVGLWLVYGCCGFDIPTFVGSNCERLIGSGLVDLRPERAGILMFLVKTWLFNLLCKIQMKHVLYSVHSHSRLYQLSCFLLSSLQSFVGKL